MSTLDERPDRGLIEAVEPDQPTAAQWLDDAGRLLGVANKTAGRDPSGAYVLAYDVARSTTVRRNRLIEADPSSPLYHEMPDDSDAEGLLGDKGAAGGRLGPDESESIGSDLAWDLT